MSLIYWDSCVVIYRVEGVAPWSDSVAARMQSALAQGFALCVTDLTWMECRVGPMASARAELLARYDSFFARPELVRQDVNHEVFALATQLRARHRIKTPDALHLSAAIVAGCDEFWTNDKQLAAAAEGRVRVININQAA